MAAPSPEHAIYASAVGMWDATAEFRPGPGAPPMTSTGVATSRLACGGLWLVTDYDGGDFQGHGLHGYDPAKGLYVGTWVDSERSFLAVLEGTFDAATRTLTMRAGATLAGGRRLEWRETTEERDADTRIWRIFVTGPDGAETEQMTVTYRRRA